MRIVIYIKKSIKNYKYNLISLMNVLSGFILTILLISNFGSTKEVDYYFTSILVLMNTNVIIGFLYSAFFQHYLKLLENNSKKAEIYYNNTIVLIFIASLIILFFYQYISTFFLSDNFVFNNFSKHYIYIIIFLGIFEVNNFVLNAHGRYIFPYLFLIFINLLNILGILFFNYKGIEVIIYSSLIAYFLSIFIQFVFISKIINIKMSLHQLDKQYFKQVIIDSFTMKLSSVINGTTDIVIAYIFTSLGEGLYSIYYYARKFSLAVFNISNGPLIKIFNKEITPFIENKKYTEIFILLRKTLLQILPMFIIGEIFVYFSISYILPFISNKFTLNDISLMKNIFIYISFFYLFLIIEYLLITIISQYYAFKEGLKINIIYAILFATFSLIIFYITKNYYTTLLILIISIIINLFLEYRVIKLKLFKDYK